MRHIRRQPPVWIRNLSIALMFVALAMSATEVIITKSQAATPHVFNEAEAGALAGAAATQSGAAAVGASGNAAVKFGGMSSAKCIAPRGAQLQDIEPNAVEFPPWKHTLGEKALIYFETANIPAEYAGYIADGANTWNQSPCIDIEVVASCPTNVNCVEAEVTTATDGNVDGHFSGGINGAGTIMTDGIITFFKTKLDGESVAQRRVTTVHEMGHAVSLSHRNNQDSIMYGSSGPNVSLNPDSVDLNNLLVLYGVAGDATHNTARPQNTGGRQVRTDD